MAEEKLRAHGEPDIHVLVSHAKKSTDEGDQGYRLATDLLSSSVLVALVTVVLGGWIGSCLTQKYQTQANQNQLALESYRGFLQAREKSVESFFSLVAEVRGASIDLIGLSSSSWRDALMVASDQDPEQQHRVEMQVLGILRAFNDSIGKWNREAVIHANRLTYYHPEDSVQVRERWSDLRDRLKAYVECARATRGQSPAGEPEEVELDGKEACSREMKALDSALGDLANLLAAAREYPWTTAALSQEQDH